VTWDPAVATVGPRAGLYTSPADRSQDTQRGPHLRTSSFGANRRRRVRHAERRCRRRQAPRVSTETGRALSAVLTLRDRRAGRDVTAAPAERRVRQNGRLRRGRDVERHHEVIGAPQHRSPQLFWMPPNSGGNLELGETDQGTDVQAVRSAPRDRWCGSRRANGKDECKLRARGMEATRISDLHGTRYLSRARGCKQLRQRAVCLEALTAPMGSALS
jgi:hypothetical protein